MAEEDPFSCPVCLEALRHPVTIPCGHNYCMSCIREYWDTHGSEAAGFRCPQCRKSFCPRPVLNQNTMFAEVVELFKNTGLQDPSASRYHRPGRTQRENSTNFQRYSEREDLCCRTHLRYCNNSIPREKHTVIVVNGEPRGNMCFWQNRATDQQLLCPPRLEESRRGSFPPERTKTLERRASLGPCEHGSKDRRNGGDRQREMTHGSGHQHGHRSGQTRGSHNQRQTETHRSRGHRGKAHGHGHNAGHGSRRRLGVLVMTGTGPKITFMDKIRAL